MYKKSTAKISIFFVSILSCLFLFSCADPSNVNTNNLDENNNLYSAMIGTWVNENDDSDKITLTEEYLRGCVSVDELLSHTCKEPITIEDFKNNTTNYDNLKWLLDFCNEKTICNYSSSNHVFDENGYSHSSLEHISYYWAYKLSTDNTSLLKVSGFAVDGQQNPKIYKRPNNANTDNNPSSISDSDLTGSYTISEANGSTFTFSSDGTWTYQYNSSTTDGTWSVSDGELTFTYSLGGYSSTAVFTVSVSSDTYTLTGKSGDYITIISSAFKITNQTALENGVVTLVKQ